MMADDSLLEHLRRIDRLFSSDNPTVTDLIEQSIVVNLVTDDTDQNDTDQSYRPLEIMYHELVSLREDIDHLRFNLSGRGTYWGKNDDITDDGR